MPRALRARLLGVLVVAVGCAPKALPPVVTERYAVMAPAAAETLAELGVADRVVAVGDFVDYPVRLRSLPKIGAYDSPNAERLVELRVTHLFTTASEAGRGEHARLGGLGIRVVALDTSTFDGTLAAISRIAEEVGRPSEARQLLERMNARIEAVRRRAEDRPRRRVLVAVGHDPIFVAGPGSHLDALLRLAGGENVAHDAVAPYQLMSLETILDRAPEVIIDSADNRPGTAHGFGDGSWGQWPFLPAVRERRVAHVDPWRLLVPGPRLADMAELMGRLIHPELFGPAAPEDLAGLSVAEEPAR